MVVDPWGDIIAQASDKEGILLCELDLDYLDKVRSNMDCLSHMRTDNLLSPVDHTFQAIRNKWTVSDEVYWRK